MGPLVPPGRVVGIDVARCVALVGMIATHTLVSIDEDGVRFVQQLAGGRASALFAVLAGVSLALMSGRTAPVRGRERAAVAAGLAVRALLITLLGLLLGELRISILVILAYYGVLFLLGIAFLGLGARWLAALSATWVVVVPVLSHLLRPHLPVPTGGNPTLGSLAEPGQLLSELTFTGTYPAVPWLAYLLAGMALGRMDLRRPRAAVHALVVGACLAAVSYAGSALLLDRPGALPTLRESPVSNLFGTLERTLEHGLYGVTPTDSWWWLAVRAPHSSTPFDLAHTIGSALVVIGIALLLGAVAPRRQRGRVRGGRDDADALQPARRAAHPVVPAGGRHGHVRGARRDRARARGDVPLAAQEWSARALRRDLRQRHVRRGPPTAGYVR